MDEETGSQELDALYHEVILDHYRRPRNSGVVEEANLKGEGFNPFCGDRIALSGKVDGEGRISEVGIAGEGCAISQASASMMGELLKGGSLDEAGRLVRRFKGMMYGDELSEEELEELGEMAALEGVKRFPIRVKCALLPWSTLQDAMSEHTQG